MKEIGSGGFLDALQQPVVTRNGELSVALRPERDNDRSLLLRIYADSRFDEMAQLPQWSDEQKRDFLQFQFDAQHTHYRQHYPNASYQIVVLEGEDIGRLYLDQGREEIRLMDISLLRPYRGRGIGRALMQRILDAARAQQRFVSLHVEPDNIAKQLYLSLGFEVVGEISFYQLMHCH